MKKKLQNNRNLRLLALMVFVALQGMLSSCSTLQLATAECTETGLSGISTKFVIVQKAGDSTLWQLVDPVVFENKNSLYGTYVKLGAIGEMDKTNVVYIYVSDYTLEADGQARIPLSSIFRIEYYKINHGKTIGAAVAVGTVTAITIYITLANGNNSGFDLGIDQFPNP
ncbi:MAG: hypothetical protein HKO56_02005 [Bacteroidia bacterium]|nr:hypothetical protein [Bacteroidia bacterium]